MHNNYYKFQPPKSWWLLISDNGHCPKFQSLISLDARSQSDYAAAWSYGDLAPRRTTHLSRPHSIQTAFGAS